MSILVTKDHVEEREQAPDETKMKSATIKVTILYGSSCVGKTTLVENSSSDLYKVEMDDTRFWESHKSEWGEHCMSYLKEHIILSKAHRQDLIVTCGGLPRPNDPSYSIIEKEYDVTFVHTLVLIRSIDDYIRNISKRGLLNKKDELIKNYTWWHTWWRESNKEFYDNVIFNEFNERKIGMNKPSSREGRRGNVDVK